MGQLFLPHASIVCATLFSVTSAAAVECDPAKILVQDTALAAVNQSLAVQQSQSKESRAASSRSSSGSFIVPDVFNVSETQKAAFNSALIEKFNLDLKASDKRWFASGVLSKNAVQAYSDCLRSSDQHVFLIPSDNIMTSENVTMRLELRSFVTSEKIPASVEIQGATFASPPSKFDMEPGGAKIFPIKRSLDDPFTFIAHVGAKGAAEINIPARSPVKFRQELRFSREVTYSKSGNCLNCYDPKPVCVELDNRDDAVIVPGSMIWEDIQHNVWGGKQVFSPGMYTPQKACLNGQQSLGAQEASIHVCGYLTVAVIAKVPLGQQESSFAKKPDYLNDACKRGQIPKR
ncbi:hypothetical protein LMTR13_03300 [Bradyrhizobium icense]|uniref:Uncharacterized protein n=2 Tax=Bradyrhizobium icense TaxID=1274631 RepID=A0A1B1U989_9BRAD|nr:hypothetical protein LMTR13_03300 [Bradyrhizobium icense]